MSSFFRHSLLVLAVLVTLPARLVAAQVPANPEPGVELRIYLLTMGQGDLVWEKFGHNAIWIHDPAAGTDLAYNYGLFDFNAPGYWGRFLRGNWIYQMGSGDARQMIDFYVDSNRSVWAQELNLTPAQKRDLQHFLEWNDRPENREYRYDYFRDNCSTRVRDALDRALGGQLRAAAGDSLTDKTFRWHSRRLIADDRVSYTGMNAGLGPEADRPITAWAEMFIPMKLQQQLRTVAVRDAAGRAAPLVASEQTLFQAVGRDGERLAPPDWTLGFLAVGMALGAALAGLGWRARRGSTARWGFAALATVWTLLAGVGGLLLVQLWTLTDHTAAHRNENLLQLNPLALALVLLVPALAYGARWAARPAFWITAAVAVLAVLGLVLQILPGLDQTNGEIVALALPAHLGLLAAVWAMRGDAFGRRKV